MTILTGENMHVLLDGVVVGRIKDITMGQLDSIEDQAEFMTAHFDSLDEATRQMRHLVGIYRDLIEAPETRVMNDGHQRLVFIQRRGGAERAAHLDTANFLAWDPITVLVHVMRELDRRAGGLGEARIRVYPPGETPRGEGLRRPGEASLAGLALN